MKAQKIGRKYQARERVVVQKSTNVDGGVVQELWAYQGGKKYNFDHSKRVRMLKMYTRRGLEWGIFSFILCNLHLQFTHYISPPSHYLRSFPEASS